MKRRTFLGSIGAAVAAWVARPVAALASNPTMELYVYRMDTGAQVHAGDSVPVGTCVEAQCFITPQPGDRANPNLSVQLQGMSDPNPPFNGGANPSHFELSYIIGANALQQGVRTMVFCHDKVIDVKDNAFTWKLGSTSDTQNTVSLTFKVV